MLSRSRSRWRLAVGSPRSASGFEDYDAGIVSGHPEAWASGDPDRVGDLYADGAVLRDSIAGITVNGAAAIAALGGVPADQGGLPGAALRAFSDNTDASFINGPSQFVLLLDVGDEGSCPGPVAVVLDLDEQGLITHEERYHRIDALRRCLPADDRPTGWWSRCGSRRRRTSGSLVG